MLISNIDLRFIGLKLLSKAVYLMQNEEKTDIGERFG